MTEEKQEKDVVETFVLIQIGCEGIERLLWTTQSEQEARDKIKEIKDRADKLKAERDAYFAKFGELSATQKMEKEDDWLEMKQDQLGDGNFSYRDLSANRYCMMSFKDGDNEFSCICSRLGAGLKQPFLY